MPDGTDSLEPGALAAAPAAREAETPWWRGAVIYQIYPRSFRDSNGDGIGDLPGILGGLDHVASLGVDAIWISPFFTSPMRDFGYDVADYCDVDPMFGTLADFDRLVARAHELGLKVIIDQVLSHTSDQHAWFAESRSGRTNAKADWYVWVDAKPDGSPPTNWQSVFAGPAWSWDARRRQYYLHNFLPSQPDLNLHNPDVQDALLEAMAFWLERGVDGFRLDAVNFLMHDPELKDNPPTGADPATITRPFDLQRHLHNQSHPAIAGFLERVRALTDRYGTCFTVAEVGGPTPLAEMRAFTEGERRLNSAYSFDYLYARELTPELVRRASGAWPGAPDEGWPSWAFSNHDAPRAVSRWAGTHDRALVARLLTLLLLSLRGNAFLYQGEELGLPQGEVTFDHLQDPEAIANWPHTLGRDGARTPFPWLAAGREAGFSTGQPWLPMDPAHVALALERQERDPVSTLVFTRRALAVRRAMPALRMGTLDVLEAPEPLLAFERCLAGERCVCVYNLGDQPVSWRPPGEHTLRLLLAGDGEPAGPELPEHLAPRTGYWALATGPAEGEGRSSHG